MRYFALIAPLLLIGCVRQEASFPSRPITIVVPWAAGGGTDQLARIMAEEAAKIFGVGVNVLNRDGGAGTVGHIYGMKARPDGYTVTMVTYELCSYKPLNRAQIGPGDYKALLQLNEDPGAITIHADSPWKTLKELIDYSREHPKEITVGNSGPGAVWHIGAVKLENMTGVRFTHIPLDGAKPAVTRLLGKHIQAVAVSPAEVEQYVREGTFRCLGIMSEERFADMPEVPTMQEQGIELVHGTWRGLAVHKETPDDIAAKLANGFKQAYDQPSFQAAAKRMLMGLKYRNGEDFSKYMQKEAEDVAALITELGL
ncbi:MAG: tripartite tricarboxylate transporter substrate binding protein [Candidatus Omnitrophota bacterium]